MQIFDKNKNWYKGNTHTHTTNSDGRKSPEDVMRVYKENGYDFLTITDHRKSFPETEYEGMTVLSGTEIDYNHLDKQVLHLTAFGLETEPDFEKALKSPEDGVEAIKNAGGLVIMAHPHWSLNTIDIMDRIKGICGIEVYNTLSGSPWNSDRADSAEFCDVAYAHGYHYPMIASDDSHFYTGEECKSYIMVNAKNNSREALKKAIENGKFYASRGPVIDQVTVDGDHIEIECSPSDKVIFYSDLVWVGGRCRTGNGLTHAEYDRSENETFVRIEVIDANGMKAYYGPIAF